MEDRRRIPKTTPKHEKEFALIVKDRLKERAKKQYELDREYLSRPIAEVAKTPPPLLNTDEFADLKSYSNNLMISIVRDCLVPTAQELSDAFINFLRAKRQAMETSDPKKYMIFSDHRGRKVLKR